MTSISDTNVVNAPGGLVELGYGQITSSVAVTSTSFTTPTTIIPDVTVVCDGSPILVEFYAPQTAISAGQSQIVFALWEDGVEKHRYWLLKVNPTGSTGTDYDGVKAEVRLTPSAGSHTYRVVGISSPANNSVLAGSGTTTNSPAFLRVSKIIQASQLIVQTPNAPLVTSLPSNAIDGQEVRYLADNTNGIIWNLRYRAGSSSSYKWEFIGGTDLVNRVWNGWQTESTSSTSYVDLASVGPQLTPPLAGEYRYVYGGLGRIENLTYLAYINLSVGGVTASDRESIAYGNDVSGYTNTGSFTVTNSSTNVKMVYRSGGATNAWFMHRYLSIIPIRVSA